MSTRDLLADGGGLLFAVGDVVALAERLEWMVENPDLARELGKTAEHT